MRAQPPAPGQMRRPVVDMDIRRRRPSAAQPAAPVAAEPKKRSLSAMAVAATLASPPAAPEEAAAKPAPATGLPPVPVPPPTSHLPLDMELPGEDSAARAAHLKRQAKWRQRRRMASRGLAAVTVLLITLGGLLVSQNLHKVFRGEAGTAAALKSNVNPDLLKGEGRGRVNVLLLGRGGGNHDAPDLTDTMMLVSIDPVNHTAAMLSLPRDLWVNVPDMGVMKINAAWESGEFKYLGKSTPGSTDPKAIKAGFNTVDQTVQSVLGVDIDYNVLLDFQAFRQAVDTVGGISVNVPSDLVDPTMAWENKGSPILAKAGLQDFNGKQALIYVRSRETTSDFARAQRQRAVLLALKSRVETLGTLSNPFKLSGLFNAFGNNVATDLSISNANRLYSILKGISGANISSIDLDGGSVAGAPQYVAGGNMNGQSIVLPKAGLFQYGDIQRFIRSQLKDPYIIKEKARVVVLNGTIVPNAAANEATELQSYGYNIVKVGNTPNSGWTQTTLVDLSHGRDKYTKHYLEQRLGMKAVDKLMDNSIPTNGADFVIIIGSNEASPAQP